MKRFNSVQHEYSSYRRSIDPQWLNFPTSKPVSRFEGSNRSLWQSGDFPRSIGRSFRIGGRKERKLRSEHSWRFEEHRWKTSPPMADQLTIRNRCFSENLARNCSRIKKNPGLLRRKQWIILFKHYITKRLRFLHSYQGHKKFLNDHYSQVDKTWLLKIAFLEIFPLCTNHFFYCITSYKPFLLSFTSLLSTLFPISLLFALPALSWCPENMIFNYQLSDPATSNCSCCDLKFLHFSSSFSCWLLAQSKHLIRIWTFLLCATIT